MVRLFFSLLLGTRGVGGRSSRKTGDLEHSSGDVCAASDDGEEHKTLCGVNQVKPSNVIGPRAPPRGFSGRSIHPLYILLQYMELLHRKSFNIPTT